MGQAPGETAREGARADRYFIKSGYRARAQAETIEGEPGDYWTPDRIEGNRVYQWHVYALARELVRRMGDGASVLDVGCGYPGKIELLREHAATVTLIDQPTLAGVIRRDFPDVEFVPMDLERPGGLAGRRFDLIVFSDVVEHLLDPDPCMRFLGPLLAPAGRALVSTPERDVLRGPDCMTSNKPEHVREWNEAEFRSYLESHGYRVQHTALLPTRLLTGEEMAEIRETGETGTPRTSGCQLHVCGHA